MGGKISFDMDSGSFGIFAQRMFDVGLVFNIDFTDDELLQLPNWRLFNQKIMAGVSSLPANINLPPPARKLSESVNHTLWAFVKHLSRPVQNQPGTKKHHLVGGEPIPTAKWTLDHLMREFSIPNPISGPDAIPVPQRLIIIGGSLEFVPKNTCIFDSKKPPVSLGLSQVFSLPWVT